MGVLGSILAFGRALREMKLRAPGMIMQCYAARKGLHVFYPHLAAQTKVSTKIRFILPFFCFVWHKSSYIQFLQTLPKAAG